MSAELRKLCIETYQGYIREHARIPKELKRALKTHERVPVFIDRMVGEIKKAPKAFTRESIISVTRDMAEIFILNVERMAEERLLSPLKKAQMRQKADEANQFRQSVAELEKKGTTHVTKTKEGITETTTFQIEDTEGLGI